MVRQLRQQIDEGILDQAAALFARRGYAQTSVQAIADAVGYSKAGLLHHFPSKDALWHAVLDEARTVGLRLVDGVADLPAGRDRDQIAVAAVTDIALARPGLVALLLSSVTDMDAGGPGVPPAPAVTFAEVVEGGDAIGALALRAFGVDPALVDGRTGAAAVGVTGTADRAGTTRATAERVGAAGSAADTERCVRVVGALAGLAVLALAAHRADRAAAWRPHIVATCMAALGHHDQHPNSHQAEV